MPVITWTCISHATHHTRQPDYRSRVPYDTPPPSSCCAFLLETAGDAGSGGNGGWSYAVFDLDPDDASRPILEGNTLSPGSPGEGNAINGAVGMAGETNF